MKAAAQAREMPLKELFRRAESLPVDFIGASGWQSLKTLATEAEDRFFATPCTDDEAASAHARAWGAALEELCPLSLSGHGFPRDWFYRSWYRYRIVEVLVTRIELQKLPEVGDEARPFLTGAICAGILDEIRGRLRELGYTLADLSNEKLREIP